MTRLFSVCSTVPGKRPRIESYFSSCASVRVSVMSLTPTQSMSAPAAWAARKRLRPIRPNPLIPADTAIGSSFRVVSLVSDPERTGVGRCGTFGNFVPPVGETADRELRIDEARLGFRSPREREQAAGLGRPLH